MADTAVYSADGKWSVSGTTATYKVGDKVVAKITGLASGLTADALNATSSNTLVTVTAPTGTDTVGTIKLKQAALGTSAKTVLTLSNGGSYKLDLDGDVTKLVIGTPTLSTSSGKATLTGNITTAGHMVTDDKTIVYSAVKSGVTLATVSGLVSSIPTDAVTNASGTKVLTLTADAFNKKKVTISSGYGFTLALDSPSTDDTDQHKYVGGTTEDATWSVSGTTATYKQTKTAQYDLAADGKSVTYTAAKTATLATVKGLDKTGLSKATLGTNGITGTTATSATAYTAGTALTLDSTVLGTSKVTLTNGKDLDGTASTYKLTLATSGSVPATPTENTNIWAVSGTTATYKSVTTAGYTLTNDTTITYSKQTAGTTLATVKGLAKGLTAEGKNTDAVLKNGDTAVVSVSGAGTEAGPYTIQLKKGALTNTNVTLTPGTDKYANLTIYTTDDAQKVTAPTISKEWSVNGTTATLKGTVTAEGWELDTATSSATCNKKITYTKTSSGTTLATVKNLKTGLKTSDLTGNTGAVKYGDTKDAADGKYTITLGSDALGTKNITLSATNYKLALASGVPGQSGSAPDDAKIWAINGTTATYKTVTPAYYTLAADAKSVTYKAEDAGKTAEQKTAAVIATVEGLKAGLTADDDSINDSTGAEVVKITSPTANDGSAAEKAYAIQLKKGALTTTNVTLTPGTGKFANLAVYDSTASSGQSDAETQTVAEPTLTGSIKWAAEDVAASGSTPASTTVILRSQANEGWTLSNDKQSITHAPASTATDVATITGLKAGLAANETHGIFATAAEAAAATSASTLITLASKAITLTADAVGEQSIAVTGDYGYTFATVDKLVLASNGTAPTATDMWVLGSTAGTAEYKEVSPKYFTYDATSGSDDTTKLMYHAQTPSTDAAKVKATLTGLAEGLEVSGDGQSIKDADGTVIEFNTSNTTQIDVSEGALAQQNLVLENKNSSTYTLATNASAPEAKYSLTYDGEAGTATLSEGTTEGYKVGTVDSKHAIVYTAFKSSADDSAPTTKIKGLATGLDEADVIGANGTGGYITYNGTAKTITLARDVLGDTDVEFDGTSTYTFVLNSGDTFTADDTVGWTTEAVAAETGGISTTTAKLYAAKTAAYALAESDKKVTRTAPSITGSTAKATITGLSSGLSAVETAIEGIELVDTNSDNTYDLIKLSNNVLAGSTSAVATLDGTGYTLALGDDVQSSDAVNTFSIASGTLTYTTTNPAGYALSDDNTKVTYTDEMVDKTTIAGLKSSLNISEKEVTVTPNGSDVTLTTGITLTAPFKSTTDGVDDTPGTFKIGSKAVGKKDITLTNDDGNAETVSGDFDYNIALDGVTNNPANPVVWNKTNKTTTATYTQTFAKGYTKTDDEHIVYASKNTKKTYATLSGLNKSVVANADGSINGITIDPEAVVTLSATGNATVTSADNADDLKPVIILSDPSLFTTTDITLGKNDNYYLAVADGFATQNADLHWTYANGTANLVKGTTEGWQIKETKKSGTTTYDNKTIKYSAADDGTVFAKVTGLNKSLEINDDGTIDGLDFTAANGSDKGTIFVGEAAVEGITGKVELKVGSTSYALAFGDGIGLPEAEKPEWVVSKGTATYQYDVSEGWKLNSEETPTSMTYQAAKTTPLTTITGLNPALEIAGEDIQVTEDYYEQSEDGTEYVGISSIEKGTIELSANALSTNTVKFKEAAADQKYALKLADDVWAEGVTDTNLEEDQNADAWKDQTGWVTNATTATYQEGYNKAHYKFNTKGEIAFVAATKVTPTATVKGIKSGVEITDENGLITLDSSKLDGKTVTVTGDGYALALDSSDTDIVESKYINKQWKTSGTKATLTGTLTTGYQTSADGKTITYTGANKKNQTIATVAGIKSGVNITDCVDESDKTITLNKAQLGTTAVTLTNTANQGYTLALGDDASAPVIESTAWDVSSKGVATLTGKVKTAGYTVAHDEQSIAYTAATATNKTTTLATITGINTAIDSTTLDNATDSGTITLTNEMLGGNATVDGKNLFKFSFDDDYSNKKVTGTTAVDELTVAGTGISVEGGKGNDNIDFGGAGGNTLVYASGDGDDVVVNFTESDIISSTKSVITGDNIKTEYDSSGAATGNVLVTIGKNTITLDNYSGSTLTITDKNGTKTYEKQDTNPFWTIPPVNDDSSSNVLLADNNYSADAAALSDIVEPFKASYTPYDFEGGLDLVKKDSFAPAITFNGTDKK